MSQAWKSEERAAAKLLGDGHRRYPANSGHRIDVEGPRFIAQVKHRRVCSLAELERLAVEMADLGRQRGKVGICIVKRKAGCGNGTPRLIVMTERAFTDLVGGEHA